MAISPSDRGSASGGFVFLGSEIRASASRSPDPSLCIQHPPCVRVLGSNSLRAFQGHRDPLTNVGRYENYTIDPCCAELKPERREQARAAFLGRGRLSAGVGEILLRIRLLSPALVDGLRHLAAREFGTHLPRRVEQLAWVVGEGARRQAAETSESLSIIGWRQESRKLCRSFCTSRGSPAHPSTLH